MRVYHLDHDALSRIVKVTYGKKASAIGFIIAIFKEEEFVTMYKNGYAWFLDFIFR